MKNSRKIRIFLFISMGLTLATYLFPKLFGVSPIPILKTAAVSTVETAGFSLQYALTREMLTLTVDIDHPDVKVIQVYSGSHREIAGNPSGNLVFPKAKLVTEKNINSPGKVTFELKPGKYFIYPWIKTRIHGFGGRPLEVYLDRDKQVRPSYSYNY